MNASGDALDERRLPGSVSPDDADCLAGLHVKRDILQRPELFVPSQAAARQRFFQTITGPRIGPILFRDVLNAKGRRHSLEMYQKSGRELRARAQR